VSKETPPFAGPNRDQDAVTAGTAWDALFDTDARERIERDHLPGFLTRQRWFGGKGRTIAAARIADWGVLAHAPDPAFLLLVDVRFEDGGVDRYFLPMALAAEPLAGRILADHRDRVLAAVRGARTGVLHDALETGAARDLLDAIAAAREIRLRRGLVRALPASGLAQARREDLAALAPRRMSGEQSNTSIVFGDRLVLKLVRRVEPGPNPEHEIGHHLTERVGFSGVPRLAGALEYLDPAEAATTLGVLQALVPHQACGWDHALQSVRRFYDRALSRAEPAPEPPAPVSLLQLGAPAAPPAALEAMGGYLEMAAALGRRTAALHAALADARGDPAFEPEPMTAAAWQRLAASLRAHGDAALQALAAGLGRVSPELAGQAAALIARRDAIAARFDRLAALDAPMSAIRVHGDYHLGQVLVADGDVVILDFEGEPLKSIAERRSKQPALKDVAGMLRSFDYAAYAALFEVAQGRPEVLAALEPWARIWQMSASASFLDAYRTTAGRARFVPADARTFEALLDGLLLDKALYELLYELNNRPAWLRIPIRSIVALVEPGGAGGIGDREA
jgi:maltose alpha-D-glucosyltransferase/alpha-amylase